MAEQLPDRRHDHVLHQRRDNLSEGRTDDDADRQIHDIATHGEFLEFFQHGRSPLCFSIKVFDGPGEFPETGGPSIAEIIVEAEEDEGREEGRTWFAASLFWKTPFTAA